MAAVVMAGGSKSEHQEGTPRPHPRDPKSTGLVAPSSAPQPMASPGSVEARFWPKVDKSGDCWEWVATRNAKGYGLIQDALRIKRAHRVSWELHNGPIPEGSLVLHRCDNPPCVRPDHLFLGTPRDNTQDAIAKGRFRWRAGHEPKAFTPEVVQRIRERYAAGELQRLIAADYGLDPSTVGQIGRRRIWI